MQPILVGFLYFISHWISTTQDNKVIYIITSMVDVEKRRKEIVFPKSRVPPVVQMFVLAQDWFMVFPALVRLVIFTTEHVYSGNPGDRFSAQGVISHNKLVIYSWYKAVWVYVKHGVYSKQYSLAKRADKSVIIWCLWRTLAVSHQSPWFRPGLFRTFWCVHDTPRSTTRMQRMPGVSWLV